ncbi:GAF domain-containing protein [Alcaligenaceae bacterium]|nr:GAF domain-containing protein [Alcaligenaceae bacterium]
MEMILSSARYITGADAGTLYMLAPDAKALQFAIIQNDTLKVHLGSTGADKNHATLVPLYHADGTPDDRTVAACSVLKKSTINIANAYDEQVFDFSGTRRFDTKTGYRSVSFLTVPLCNHDNEVIAALQLINKLDASKHPIPFDAADQDIVESLASQAAVALTNQQLITEMRVLFDSFTRVIGAAIDAKSPHTGAHCRRVPDATLMLARAASGANFPGLEGFVMSDDDMYELQTAAWLHDCGKVVTPHHIMEKSTKLETIIDRISSVSQRFDILARDLQQQKLTLQLHAARQGVEPDGQALARYDAELDQLADDQRFLEQANTGAEFMSDADIQRVQALSRHSWVNIHGETCYLLSNDEVLNLCVKKGTLNPEERQTMEDHMVHTLKMLEQLPFPRHLQRVTEYAVGHHERMDGKGYPRGLTREQLSIPARIMGIADVFEALTAHERPYKSPMSLSQALRIMGTMVENQHLDPDLFALFVKKRVYLTYAYKHLRPEQIDDVDISRLPGLCEPVDQ